MGKNLLELSRIKFSRLKVIVIHERHQKCHTIVSIIEDYSCFDKFNRHHADSGESLLSENILFSCNRFHPKVDLRNVFEGNFRLRILITLEFKGKCDFEKILFVFDKQMI